MSEQTRLLLIVIGLTVVSGIGDSYGFLHAAQVWRQGEMMWDEVAKSALGFACGAAVYWVAIRYFQQFGATFAETQTIIWFAVTIIGVALLSGKFLHWEAVDKAIAITVLAGIGWLLFRTGA